MSSIRSRLATGYAVTLLLTLGGFCAAVYYELRKPSISGLDAQLAGERDLAVQYLSESHRVLGRLVPPGGSPALGAGRCGRVPGHCATTCSWSIPPAASSTPRTRSPRCRSSTSRP